ncbi:uncharacterized protein Triagg1_8947 [Trichoderma aggressivum f. europaeum]|uniref:Uncharacterized protein n=1 Tax=Trichoderma aggressivum f. europaeum TaxID=173218 RepID=A0AAE1I7M0_9HYPO|nr:hypothetical protein Triagg1_8947 [Trichoderma aggressivum f. europaeum]
MSASLIAFVTGLKARTHAYWYQGADVKCLGCGWGSITWIYRKGGPHPWLKCVAIRFPPRNAQAGPVCRDFISLMSMGHLRRNVIVFPLIPAPVDSQTARDAVRGPKPLPSVAANRNEWKPYEYSSNRQHEATLRCHPPPVAYGNDGMASLASASLSFGCWGSQARGGRPRRLVLTARRAGLRFTTIYRQIGSVNRHNPDDLDVPPEPCPPLKTEAVGTKTAVRAEADEEPS